MSIFNHIKNITTIKGNYLGEEDWNNFMINRFLSMNREYCEVVNYIQKNTWQLKGEYLYNLYKDIIPKQYVYLKYIKPTRPTYDMEVVEAVRKYFEISNKEAKEYINVLPQDELEHITSQIQGK
jgi:hypothetical protein